MMTIRREFLLQAAAISGIAQALPTQPKPDIFQSAGAGDVPRATELANADPQVVRLRSSKGRTALHIAAAAGKPDMVMFLLSRGADLNAGPETPLIAAVDYPDHATASEMSQTLLANASDPNAIRADGKTALQLASARHYGDIVEMLIHRGAAATGPEAGADELVHFARRYALDIHGNPFTRDDTQGLPWTTINPFVTVAHFDFEKVKQLRQARPLLLNTRSTWDELAIEAASHMGLFPMAEWLAEQGSPVSTCTAALLGQDGLVKRSIAADPQSVHERGAHDIALLAYTAYAKEQTGIADRLLTAGANVHAKALGLTTLHLAAGKGYLDLASLLIGHGADVNASAKVKGEIMTPLAMAARARQAQMEQLLRNRGAR